MAKYGVHLKIDVTNIDKDRLFKGEKGTYLDATVFIDTDNQDEYGRNGMITQDVSKDERDNGVKGPILGNCKVFWQGDGRQSQESQQPAQQPPQSDAQHKSGKKGFDDFDDDIPF